MTTDFAPSGPIRGIPRVAIVVLTFRCNSRCNMCNIWEDHNARHMPLPLLRRVFSEPFVSSNIRSVNLTGGELFLRKDIAEVHATLVDAVEMLESVTINTNGMLIERMEEALGDIVARQRKRTRPIKTLVYMSLDGTEATHDRVRGVPGGFRKVHDAVEMMRPMQEAGEIDVGLNFTITKDNFREMPEVMEIARSLGVELSYTLAMTSSMYFKNDTLAFRPDDTATMNAEVAQFLRESTASGALPDPSRYYRNLAGMLGGRPRAVGCIFKRDGFFLEPEGNVYPCWGHEQKIGNVNDATLTELWNGGASDGIRGCIEESCRTCPNNCYIKYQRYDRVRAMVDGGAKRFAEAAGQAGTAA